MYISAYIFIFLGISLKRGGRSKLPSSNIKPFYEGVKTLMTLYPELKEYSKVRVPNGGC